MSHQVRCPNCNRTLGLVEGERFVWIRHEQFRPRVYWPVPVNCRCGATLLVCASGEAVYSCPEAQVSATVERPGEIGK